MYKGVDFTAEGLCREPINGNIINDANVLCIREAVKEGNVISQRNARNTLTARACGFVVFGGSGNSLQDIFKEYSPYCCVYKEKNLY